MSPQISARTPLTTHSSIVVPKPASTASKCFTMKLTSKNWSMNWLILFPSWSLAPKTERGAIRRPSQPDSARRLELLGWVLLEPLLEDVLIGAVGDQIAERAVDAIDQSRV